MYSYFHKTKLDETFYIQHLRDRLPGRIIDAHAHFNLPEHVASITEDAIARDWALECGMLMTYEDAQTYMSVMFPGQTINHVALPWPLRDADTAGNNAYIASLIKGKGLRGLYTLRPEYDIAQIEKSYTEGCFCGFKPYPYMASATKGADVSIFDFMTHAQFALADRLHAAVLMHLPRAGRLMDLDNISEIRIILDRYPNVRLVLAHFGRCFHHDHFERGLEALCEDVHRLWFDTSAVLNPKVHALANAHVDHRRIMFGSDIPILLWHGKREWGDKGYHNLCREDFSWNEHRYPEDEAGYVFFLYEQLNNMLNTYGDDRETILDIFQRNAERVYVK